MHVPFMSVYLYESGSLFEEIFNQYMVSGSGINPYDPRRTPALNSDGQVAEETVGRVIAPNVTDHKFGDLPSWVGTRNPPQTEDRTTF